MRPILSIVAQINERDRWLVLLRTLTYCFYGMFNACDILNKRAKYKNVFIITLIL